MAQESGESSPCPELIVTSCVTWGSHAAPLLSLPSAFTGALLRIDSTARGRDAAQ